jgi:hypothetical protein
VGIYNDLGHGLGDSDPLHGWRLEARIIRQVGDFLPVPGKLRQGCLAVNDRPESVNDRVTVGKKPK